MFHQKLLTVIYIDREKLTYYPATGNPVTFSYPQKTILELEVVNEEEFEKELTNFITNSKFTPASLGFIISPELLYEKEIHDEVSSPGGKPVEQNQEKTSTNVKVMADKEEAPKPQTANLEERGRQIQIFLDSVPFEETINKTYKIEKGIKVVVTNKALVDVIKGAFARQNFIVELVVPVTMLGKDIITGSMNQDAANKIIAKFESLKQLSILEEASNQAMLTGEPDAAHGIQMTTKVSSKREYGLIGVFACLLIILGYVTYTTLIAPPAEEKIASISQTPTITPQPSLVPSTTPDASASASLVNKSALRVQVNGGTSLQADLIRQQLQASGFTNISVKPGTIPATGKAVIIFSNSLSEPAKQVILDEVKKNLLNVTVQTSTLTDFDAIVNL